MVIGGNMNVLKYIGIFEELYITLINRYGRY